MTDLDTRPATREPPPEPSPVTPRALGPGGWLRYAWTQLTSMRTALVLLFALAVAAIPGSLVPQRNVTPVAVSDFLAAHPRLGPVYSQLGLFEVYRSPWFAAVYLLLFTSLVGCIVPRVKVYARALRAEPPRAPRNLARLPAYTSVGVAGDPDGLLEHAATTLRARHYRVRREGDAVSAERGQLREAGNLVFHLSLLVLLLGVALGGLFGFRGSSVVVVGQSFSNLLTQYSDISAGSEFNEDDLTPFSLRVTNFDVKFETGNVQRGAARLFRADVELTRTPGGTPQRQTLEVNRPLAIGGTSVHLVGHGYAPKVTVTDGNGDVAFSGPVVFLPQDGNFTSAGVIKVPDAQPERMAFQGFFLPTAVVAGESQAPSSAFPDALNPALLVAAWAGPPRAETGRPENVYSLDPTGLTPMKDAKGADLRIALQPGDVVTLPGGRGTVALDGWERWVKLQIGDTPGVGISLAAIGFGVAGLCLSLFVRPRRLWVRVREQPQGTTLVEVAGLDRADARSGLGEEVDRLAAEVTLGKPISGRTSEAVR